MEQILYVGLSRDKSDFIFCSFDKDKVVKAIAEQIISEEMEGGRPSVYIKETTLK
jgi:hypothetical protein